MAKIGMLGSTALNVVNQIKGLKGATGINKTAGIAGIAGGAADTLDNVLFGDQRVKNSNLTNGMNDAYDFASSALMTMGGPATIVGGVMKGAGLISDGLTALGVGTDQMTTTDKILDSKLLKLTPIGLANGLFSSTSDRFSVNNTVREQIGGSYGGAYAFMDDAASRAGKKSEGEEANNEADILDKIVKVISKLEPLLEEKEAINILSNEINKNDNINSLVQLLGTQLHLSENIHKLIN
jgi:hypothetical protein